MLRAAPLLLSLLAGCPFEDSAPPEVDLSRLTEAGGCRDVVLYIASEEGDLMMVFEHYGELARAAYEAGGLAEREIELPLEGNLWLWEGQRLPNLECNDFTDGSEVIDRTWTVTSGSAYLSVDTRGVSKVPGEYLGDGVIVLTDVVLESDDGDPIEIETMSWSALVGWVSW